ncbi:hypothetical protein PWR63_35100 [Paraburkholderia sp. A2WS-5]
MEPRHQKTGADGINYLLIVFGLLMFSLSLILLLVAVLVGGST